jgi:hypothetical protein
MNKQEFKILFLKSLNEAAFHVEQRFSRQISRCFEIELHGAGYRGVRITPEKTVDALFIDSDHFYRVIDVSVIEIHETKTCVFVRVSAHKPSVFAETWNQPLGMGPFKLIHAKQVRVFDRSETSHKVRAEDVDHRSGKEDGITTVSVTLANSLPDIVASLKQVQSIGEPIENFVIFFADKAKNIYIQVALESTESPYSSNVDEYSLYAEAVGNAELDSQFRLNTTQIEKLKEIGWKESSLIPNYYQTWHAKTNDERTLIAQTIIDTFINVYGVSPSRKIEGQVVIPNT